MAAVPHHLYPFEGQRLELDGLSLHYLDEGQGSPVVMVHGNPSWSLFYRNLVERLRGQYRTLVPDHIGCGLSEKPPLERYPYTLERRIADLTAFIDRLELDQPVTLVLHDWGGMIGMSWAVANPTRVARLVLLNTAAFPLPSTKALPFTLGLVRNTRFGGWLVRRFNAFSRGATTMAVCKPMSRELRDAYTAPYDTPANRIATLRFVQDIPLGPQDPAHAIVTATAERLHLFTETPTLICWGMRDFVFDRHFLERWLEYLPHAQVHRFEDAGHYVLEDACESICTLVAEFLSATDDATEAPSDDAEQQAGQGA
mgnify:CR=1 FL=1